MILECNERPGVYRAHSETLTADDILEAAQAIMDKRFARGALFADPEAAKTFLRHKLADKDREVFAVVFLDSQHRLIAFEELFQGGLTQSTVSPREIVRTALFHNAAAVLLAHNHPSGSPEPSKADEQITYRIKAALNLIEVTVLDHIVVGRKAFSFRENKICQFD